MTNPVDEVRDRARAEEYLSTVKSGTALHQDSPGGKSLLQSYRRWQESEQARHSDANDLAALRESLQAIKDQLAPLTATISKTLASPAVIEEAAVILSIKAMQVALHDGTGVGAALAKGYSTYKEGGGRSSEALWRKGLK
jgi:hypothetical protein